MELRLERFASTLDATSGLLFLNDKFKCFTLEDEYREHKVAGKTRIPAGTYQIKLRTGSPMAQRYDEKYPDHAGMLWLQDVPGFEWIYLHVGNTHKHTSGCILVGLGARARANEMSVQNSRVAYQSLYAVVFDAAQAGSLTIKIIDRD